jgi:carbon-monoxide dehydrogenase iron sulfur subunit
MAYLSIHHEKCTGCRACELACSYHHTKVFNPRLASLHIQRNEREGTISIIPWNNLPENDKESRLPCDRCHGEAEPFCVKYCPTGAIAKKAEE